MHSKHPYLRFLCITIALLGMALLPPIPSSAEMVEPAMRFGLGALKDGCFSPDGRFYATGGGAGAVLWDARTGERLRIYHMTASASAVAFSPDGKWLAATDQMVNFVEVFDIASGQLIGSIPAPINTSDLCFSPDGTKILIGSNQAAAQLREFPSGNLLATFQGKQSSSAMMGVQFSDNGERILIACYHDNAAYLYDAHDYSLLHTFSQNSGVREAGISPDGSRIAIGALGSNGKKSALYNGTTYAKIVDLPVAEWSSVYSYRFSKDGQRLVTADWISGDSDSVFIWNAQNGSLIAKFGGHDSTTVFAEFSSDGSNILSGSDDGVVVVRDAATLQEKFRNQEHPAEGMKLAVSPDGLSLITANLSYGLHNPLFFWDACTGERITQYDGTPAPTISVDFMPDGTHFLAGDYNGLVTLREIGSSTPSMSFNAGFRVNDVKVSPDGQYILTVNDYKTVKLWRANGQFVRTYTGTSDNFVPFANFSPDGSQILTAGSVSGQAVLIDRDSGQIVQTYQNSNDPIDGAFSPDGTKLAIIANSYFNYVFDKASGQTLHNFGLSNSRAVAFSPDSSKIAIAGSTGYGILTYGITLYDLDSEQEIRSFIGHPSSLVDMAFSKDGSRLFSIDWNGVTFAWDTGLAPARTKNKLIVLAAGGPSAENTIATQTIALTNRICQAALVRGYARENIRYLSDFDNPSTITANVLPATLSALDDSITSWTTDAYRLTLWMIGPGRYDAGNQESQLIMNFSSALTMNPSTALTASHLAESLNAVQSGPIPLREVDLIVDADHSGGMLRSLQKTQQTSGTCRIVMASTGENCIANFGPDGEAAGSVSFSGLFLSTAIRGKNLQKCFQDAEKGLKKLHLPANAPQEPLLDDDADGLYTNQDGNLARRRVFGNIPDPRFKIPEFTAVTATELDLAAGSSISVNAQLQRNENLDLSRVEVFLKRIDGAADTSSLTGHKAIHLTKAGALRTFGARRVRAAAPGEVLETYGAIIHPEQLEGPGRYRLFYTVTRDDRLGIEMTIPASTDLSTPPSATHAWELYQ